MVSYTGFMLMYGDVSGSLMKVHTQSGIALTFLVLIHLALHFTWLKVMTFSLFKKEDDEDECKDKKEVPKVKVSKVVKKI